MMFLGTVFGTKESLTRPHTHGCWASGEGPTIRGGTGSLEWEGHDAPDRCRLVYRCRTKEEEWNEGNEW